MREAKRLLAIYYAIYLYWSNEENSKYLSYRHVTHTFVLFQLQDKLYTVWKIKT